MTALDRIAVFLGAGGWYWRRVARNGRVVAVGAEPFSSRWSARRAAKRANPDRDSWTWATEGNADA